MKATGKVERLRDAACLSIKHATFTMGSGIGTKEMGQVGLTSLMALFMMVSGILAAGKARGSIR